MRFFIYLILFTPLWTAAQEGVAGRIEAAYTIKEISSEGKQSLIIGKVFFDNVNDVLTHSQSFPDSNLFAFKDSTVLLVFEDSIAKGNSSALSISFSIYNLILDNQISDFGLYEKGFKRIKVSQDGDKVISEWIYPSDGQFGKIVTTQKKGFLEGLLFYDLEGNLLYRQFYKDYTQIDGLFFPLSIYEITYTAEGENKKITTHRNIKVNDYSDEDRFYDLYDTAHAKYIRSKKD